VASPVVWMALAIASPVVALQPMARIRAPITSSKVWQLQLNSLVFHPYVSPMGPAVRVCVMGFPVVMVGMVGGIIPHEIRAGLVMCCFLGGRVRTQPLGMHKGVT
jgi:hypothetical protein